MWVGLTIKIKMSGERPEIAVQLLGRDPKRGIM